MFFYTSLFIASLFAALVILWAYHSIMDASRAVLKTMLPETKSGPTSHLGTPGKRTRKKGQPVPWGWKAHDTPHNMAKTHGAKPLMRDNPYVESKSDQSHKPKPIRVHREDRTELGGNAYKVTRKVSDTAAGFKLADRPWGW